MVLKLKNGSFISSKVGSTILPDGSTHPALDSQFPLQKHFGNHTITLIGTPKAVGTYIITMRGMADVKQKSD